MTISIANTIAEAIAQRLALVRIAGGYFTDVGKVVFRGRHQCPAGTTTLIELEEDAALPKAEPYTAIAVQHFIVEAAAECDPDNPDLVGHQLVADICRATLSTDLTLGGLLESPLTYTGRVIQPRSDGQSIVSVQIKLDATYRFNPATQYQ